MRVLYDQSFMSDAPNGIASYLRTFLKYSSLDKLEYWSPAVKDGTITLGHNEVALRHVPMAQWGRLPARLRIMAAFAAARTQICRDGQPIIANINDQATAVAAFDAAQPIVYISHGSNHPDIRKTMKLRDYLWVRFFDQLAVSRANAVIVVSQQAHAEFSRRFPQHAAKIKYLPTFVDDEAFGLVDKQAVRQDLGIAPQTFVLVYAGRLAREKRVDVAIHALAALRTRCTDAVLLLLGSGPEEARLRTLTNTLGLEGHVRFLGNCRSPKTIQTLAASDAALLLSAFEGISIFMLESLASGIPLVATDVADHRRILEENQAGYVVAVDAKPAEIADSLLRLRVNHEGLSLNALRTAKGFMASAVAPEIDAVLRTLSRR
jgi:glycosyltransferase involved in cell wall biosynthesis